MADERNLVDEEDAVKENSTKNRREKKKREKKEKKEKKNAKGNAPEPGEDEDEKGGGRLILVLTTILIIAIWMGIIGILIKTDVGGFGSTVLYPLLKDVPYVNKILPQPEETVEQTEGTEHQYGSLSEAISQIKELEKELERKKLLPEVSAMFTELAPYAGFGMKLVFGNVWLFGPVLKAVMPAISAQAGAMLKTTIAFTCLLYTSDAADEL